MTARRADVSADRILADLDRAQRTAPRDASAATIPRAWPRRPRRLARAASIDLPLFDRAHEVESAQVATQAPGAASATDRPGDALVGTDGPRATQADWVGPLPTISALGREADRGRAHSLTGSGDFAPGRCRGQEGTQ